MANLPIDMKKFKKVASDEHSTTLRHDQGHEVHIAHAPLSPKFKAQLAALPMHKAPQKYAEGGDVTAPAPDAQQPLPTAPAVASQPIVINVGGNNGNPALSAAPASTQDQAAAYGASMGIDPYAAPKPVDVPQDAQGAAYADAINAKRMPPPPAAAPAAPETPPAVSQAAPTAPQSPAQQDPYGTQTHIDQFAKGAGEFKAGVAQQAAGQIAQGNMEATKLQTAAQNIQAAQDLFKTHYADLEKERKAFQSDVTNQHIDPNRYMSSLSTGQKIGTAIGLILGGIGGGLTHTDNPAETYLHDQINRDIDAQKAELGKKENLLSANMKQFNNMKDATDMTRIMQNDLVSVQLKEAAAKATTPLAKAQALQTMGKFDIENSALLGQMAMRKTLLSGMANGQVPPEKVIMAIVPKEQQQGAYKELQDAQNTIHARDNLLSSFDQLAKENTISNRVVNPVQSARLVAAIRDPLIAELSKQTAGRFTEADSKFIGTLFPIPGDSDAILAQKRNAMNKLISEKLSFPVLKAYGIDASTMGRYAPQGQSRIQFKPEGK